MSKLSRQEEQDILVKWAEEKLSKTAEVLKKWTMHEIKDELEKRRIPLPPELIDNGSLTLKEVTKWIGSGIETKSKATVADTDQTKQLSTNLVTHAHVPTIESLLTKINELLGSRQAQFDLMQKIQKDGYYDDDDFTVYSGCIRETQEALIQYYRLLENAAVKFDQFLRTRRIKDAELLDLAGNADKLLKHLNEKEESGKKTLAEMMASLEKIKKVLKNV